MKRIFSIIAFALIAIGALAQTPEEIVKNMEAVMEQGEQTGMVMTVDIKIPIIGTLSTRAWNLGKKSYMEGSMQGHTLRIWSDGKTDWSYDVDDNEIEIKDVKPSDDSDDKTSTFKGTAEGYDLSITKETDEAWFITGKKSRNNKSKDDPKKLNMVIAKGTFYPINLSSKLKGVTLTIRDFELGVTEEKVTFDQSQFPTATVVDKRGQ